MVNWIDANNLKNLDDTTAKALEKWLLGILPQTAMTITFNKKDGSERVMRCTLVPEQLPPAIVTEEKAPRKRTEGVISVYDLDAMGWRSFVVKNVTHIQFTIP